MGISAIDRLDFEDYGAGAVITAGDNGIIGVAEAAGVGLSLVKHPLHMDADTLPCHGAEPLRTLT